MTTRTRAPRPIFTADFAEDAAYRVAFVTGLRYYAVVRSADGREVAQFDGDGEGATFARETAATLNTDLAAAMAAEADALAALEAANVAWIPEALVNTVPPQAVVRATDAFFGARAHRERLEAQALAPDVADCRNDGEPGAWVSWGATPIATTPDATPAPADVAASCLAIAEEARDAAAGMTAQGNGEAAKDLAAVARAATKAAFHASEPQRARWVGSTLLVSSATAGGVVHAVTPAGCSCEAGQHGRPCWHSALRQGHERAMDLWSADRDARAVAA